MVGCLEFLYITVGFISLFLLCHSFRAAWGVYLANVDCLNGTNRSSACLQVLRLWMDWLSGFGARQSVFRLDCLLHIGTFFSFVFRFPFFFFFCVLYRFLLSLFYGSYLSAKCTATTKIETISFDAFLLLLFFFFFCKAILIARLHDETSALYLIAHGWYRDCR